jgi:CheY-like chemotaxis protein
VVEAADSIEAESEIRRQAPDVIVMDLGLPGKNGFLIATELKQDAEYRQIPLIALSGLSQQQDRKAAAQAGFAEYLVKPSSPEAIAIEDTCAS